MSKKYIDDKMAGACIPLAMILSLGLGFSHMAFVGTLLAMAGFLNNGNVKKLHAIVWIVLGSITCLLNGYWHMGGTWSDVFFLYGSAVMLYESLSFDGKKLSRCWCLRIAVVIALFAAIDLYSVRALCQESVQNAGYLSGMLGTPEVAGLFFAMATLSDSSMKRRFVFCVALGMTGSVLGFLCLGAGLLIKRQDCMEDLLWTFLGLSFLVCPSDNLWLLIAIFLFWCVPETKACIGKKSEKWAWIPFTCALLNPWTFSYMKQWMGSFLSMIENTDWNFFVGTGQGDTMWIGSLSQIVIELGIIAACVLVLCVLSFYKRPSGCAWTLHLIFGACSFIPAPFLLGVGTGMVDACEKDRVNGRIYFFILLGIGMCLCSQINRLPL